MTVHDPDTLAARLVAHSATRAERKRTHPGTRRSGLVSVIVHTGVLLAAANPDYQAKTPSTRAKATLR